MFRNPVRTFLLLIIVGIPLLVTAGIPVPYTAIKAAAFFLLTGFAAIAFVLQKKPVDTALLKSPLSLFLAGFLLISLSSGFSGESFLRSFFGSSERMMGIITIMHFYLFFLLLRHEIKDEKSRTVFLQTSLFTSILLSIIGLTQYFFPGENIDLKAIPVMVSTLGNKAYFGYYLLLHFFLSLHLFQKKRIPWAIIPCILHFIVILLLGVRGIYLGLLVGIAVSVSFSKFSIKKKFALLILSLFIVAAAFTGARFLEKTLPNSNVVKTIQRVTDLSLKTPSIENRLIVWKLSFAAFLEHPILGWGLENYELAFNRYYDPKLLTPGLSDTWFDRSHNGLIDIFVMTGLVGGFSFLFFLGYLFFLLRKEPILLGLISAYTVSSLVEVEAFAGLVVVVMILCHSDRLECGRREGEVEESRNPFGKLRAGPIGMPKWILTLCIASIVYTVSFSSGLMLMSRATGKHIRALSWENFVHDFQRGSKLAFLSPTVKREALHNAISTFLQTGYEKNVEEIPISFLSFLDQSINDQLPLLHALDIKSWYLFGRLYKEWARGDFGQFEKAERFLQKGLLVNPRRQIFLYTLSSLQGIKKDPESRKKAMAYLENAIAVNPDAGYSYWILGNTLLRQGLEDQAVESLEQALKKGYRIASLRELTDIVPLFKKKNRSESLRLLAEDFEE